MSLEYTIKPRTLTLILVIISLYLVAQSFLGEYINTTLLHNQYNSIPSLILDEFSVNAEQTIPTWYQVILLLTAALLLALIARAKHAAQDPYRHYWTALALIFLYLSIDESAAIHEIFSDPLHIALNTSGVLSFGWQIAAAPLLIIFGVLFLRFLFHLPARTRNLFILAGVFYVGGAFVVDAISSALLPPTGELTLRYLTIGTIEEALEMAGQITFIYTLLSYMVDTQFELFINTRSTAASRNARFLWRVMLATILIIGCNVGLFLWALSQAQPLPAVSASPIPVYQSIVEAYPQDEMLVTHMPGTFGADNPAAVQYAASLLNLYQNVMVINVSADQSTIFIAGDTLPFDREALSDLLIQQGTIGFTIFDTSAVKRLAG